MQGPEILDSPTCRGYLQVPEILEQACNAYFAMNCHDILGPYWNRVLG